MSLDGWSEKNLADVATTFGRGKSRHRPRNDKSLYGGKYPFIQTGEIRNADHYVTEYEKTYNEKGLAQSKLWPAGTLCITIAANIAETAILTFEACIPDSVIGLVPDPAKADVEFIEYLLQYFKTVVQAQGKGAAQDNINMGTFERMEFPFPSDLAEQKRIVSILDEAFSAIAKAKENAEKNLLSARELFESYLNRVFTQQGTGWKEKPLEDFAEDIATGPFGSLLHKSDYITGGTPIVNPVNIEGENIVPNESKTISDKKKQELEGYILNENDVVIGRRGEMGRCAVVTPAKAGWLCGTGCFIIRPSADTNPHFLCHMLRSHKFRELMAGDSDRATMPSISNKQLAALPATLPDPETQIETIERLANLRAASRRLETIYTQTLANLDELKQSLLQKAFTGELTQSKTISFIHAPERFPTAIAGISTTDLHAGILGLAYLAHERPKAKHFGHVKGEKVAHLVENLIGIDLGRSPIKDAAGPNDFTHLKKVESRARNAGFFDVKRQDDRYVLKPKAKFDKLIEKTKNCLGERLEEIESLLEVMAKMTTRQAEIFATTFAAWNNLLIAGQSCDDDAIVLEARENWHPKKLKIDRAKFLRSIGWMRDHGFEPQGIGKVVGEKPEKKSRGSK